MKGITEKENALKLGNIVGRREIIEVGQPACQLLRPFFGVSFKN